MPTLDQLCNIDSHDTFPLTRGSVIDLDTPGYGACRSDMKAIPQILLSDERCLSDGNANTTNTLGSFIAGTPVVVPSKNLSAPLRSLSFFLLSDFAGMDVPGLALTQLGVLDAHTAFEIDPIARAFIGSSFCGARLCGSVCDRPRDVVKGAEVVTAGFPCQPYSLLGLQQGWDDSRGRGHLVGATVKYILRPRPRIVLLENVAAFVRSDGGRVLQWLVDALTTAGAYFVTHRIVCTSQHGLPQTRRRWFLIAIRADCAVHDFLWPEAIEMLPLPVILGPRVDGDSHARRPGVKGSLGWRNVDRALDWLATKGKDHATMDYIIDCNASESWCGNPTDRCPCLTRSRPQGLWSVSRGSQLSAVATMHLQGINTRNLILPASDAHTRNLTGNAMSLCVVERLLRAALIAIGQRPVDVVDRWGQGLAQADLVREVWGETIPVEVVAMMPSFVSRHFPPVQLAETHPSDQRPSRENQKNIIRALPGGHIGSAGVPSSVADLPILNELPLAVSPEFPAEDSDDSVASSSDAESFSFAHDVDITEVGPTAPTTTTDDPNHSRDLLPTWLLDSVTGLESAFDTLGGSLHGFMRTDAVEPALRERQRDLFPLPLVDIVSRPPHLSDKKSSPHRF